MSEPDDLPGVSLRDLSEHDLGLGTSAFIDECDGEFQWTLTVDLRAPGTGVSDDANHACSSALRETFPTVVFDPEHSCLWAYAKTTTELIDLVEALKPWLAARRA